MKFGVTPTGFKRKSFAEILQDIEESNRGLFGEGVIQTPQSPMGQSNTLRAQAIDEVWQVAEDVYQSYDPGQSEGNRLDALAALRLLLRVEGEKDSDFARALMNEGTANTRDADFSRAVRGIAGVTWAKIYVNDSDSADVEKGIAAHSVAVVALGGDDTMIGLAIREYVVPGIGYAGNTRVDTEVDGVCRSITFLRPAEIPVSLVLEVRRHADPTGCPAQPLSAAAATLATNLTGEGRPPNGRPFAEHDVRTRLHSMPTIEVVSVQGGRGDDPAAPLPMTFAFDEIPSFSLGNITITEV